MSTTPHAYSPYQWDTCDRLMAETLLNRYRNRTILDNQGKPFRVQRVTFYNDSPDPGWTVQFASKGPADTNPSLPPLQTRTIYPDAVLPEMWPDEEAGQ